MNSARIKGFEDKVGSKTDLYFRGKSRGAPDFEEIYNQNLINLIIASIIPFLIWGPFFPDLIVSISALFFLFYVFLSKSKYFENKKSILI